MYIPVKFYYIKVGLRGSKLYRYVFMMHVLCTTFKTHDIASHMTFRKHLIFRVTTWNDRRTFCSTPHSQTDPYRVFYCLEFFSSMKFLLPEINRRMQSFFYLTLYPPFQLAFFINLQRTVIGPSATLTGR